MPVVMWRRNKQPTTKHEVFLLSCFCGMRQHYAIQLRYCMCELRSHKTNSKHALHSC